MKTSARWKCHSPGRCCTRSLRQPRRQEERFPARPPCDTCRRDGKLRTRPDDAGFESRPADEILHAGRATGRSVFTAELRTRPHAVREEGLSWCASRGCPMWRAPIPTIWKRRSSWEFAGYYEGDYDAAMRLFRMVSDEVPLNEVFNNLAAALSRRNDASAAGEFQEGAGRRSGRSRLLVQLRLCIVEAGAISEGGGSVPCGAAAFAGRY